MEVMIMMQINTATAEMARGSLYLVLKNPKMGIIKTPIPIPMRHASRVYLAK
jgi:hypothetical protein